LADGEFIANEFVRVARSGKEIWIQAAYYPILDASGKVSKVVKFATAVTERMSAINDVKADLAGLSAGNLKQSLDRPFVPSMEEPRGNFNAAIGNLGDTMRSIGGNADAIANGAKEISATADSFSRRTEQQAASLEQTAAALEEITTTVSDSSRRAPEAGDLVSRTKQGAKASGDVVRSAVAAMDQIEQSSMGSRVSSASSTTSPSRRTCSH
jgi:methyl-accepting chemotaxis protein